MAYSGDARGFFKRARLPGNAADPAIGDDLRLATLDIGGGTTDIVVTSYRVEGQGANVTLFPKPILREGVSVAGDDVVLQVVLEHVLEPISRELKEKGLGERAEFVMHRLFGGDRGDMAVEEQLRRQQFAGPCRGTDRAADDRGRMRAGTRSSRDDRREPLTLAFRVRRRAEPAAGRRDRRRGA